MNDLCSEIGYLSINHYGEELCGDHIDVVEGGENSSIIVLADGLGSGVKASILSTLTSKIISTLMAAGLSIDQCVATVAATLPVCSVRKVAYSTFTIMHIVDNEYAEIIQYDNPSVFKLREGKLFDFNREEMTIGDKRVYRSKIQLQENDLFVAMSDGCPHAGLGTDYNFGWQMQDIIDFVETMECAGYNAKTLATLIIDQCNKLYGGKPGDDATACVVRIRKRNPMNVLFGPPKNPDDCNKMMALFFSKEGKHIVCGGTTSAIAAKYLGKELRPTLNFENPDIPPIAEIDGVVLVTDGVITVNRVWDYAKDLLEDNRLHEEWEFGRDGASLIAKLLFEEATDINFFVGRAVNPAHQNPNLPINFNIKMNLVEGLSECLNRLGKRVKVSYF